MAPVLSSKHIYIFRHGQTSATKNNRPYGWKIVHANILDEGKPALRRMANYLREIPSQQQFSSQFKRCQQTVTIIEEVTRKQFSFDKRLNELMIETFGHFKRRIRTFLQDIEKSEDQTVFICTHGGVIAGLTSFLSKGDFRREDVFYYPPPGVLIHCYQGKVELIDFN